MTRHDELLSFQIRETVFLSSDKAGIGELKELELLPDVEIIENTQEISITGCLQLYGKYEPARSAQTDESGGSETLLSAMQFTPFRLEEEQQTSYYARGEQDLAHRIPLNVTIPLSRIKEIGEIYAIVDSLDYEMKTPYQLQIQAELKISGIELKEEEAKDAKPNEVWEYVHVASQDGQQEAEPVSIDDIERKLAQLEQEVEEQRQRERTDPPAPYLATNSIQKDHERDADLVPPTYSKPAMPAAPSEQQDESVTSAGEQRSESRKNLIDFNAFHRASTEAGKQSGEGLAVTPAAGRSSESEGMAESAAEPAARKQQQGRDDSEGEGTPSTEAIAQPASGDSQQHDLPTGGETADGSIEQVSTEAEYPAEVSELAEQTDETEQLTPEAVEPEPTAPPNSEREFKVAISGKPSKEIEESINITSIFSNARRAVAEQPAAQQEGEPASETTVQDDEGTSEEMEAVGNLTSFVRGEEETFSKLKMCIIQRDETIQEIAERYSLTVSHILEVNNLSSERLVEGQVLYIPQ
ncbi:LysM peptidoglycan-binding domain-containing protein [Brevibacillus humidisoli]|uniref:LysM peptidoglycan-binding domain-containing protein n=1 Tax=Brevibacillus humidisoli TaxID=2895522 RepID=UPI001E30A151|nr:LysM peptidoglycan-binding domain-containing protein [Brevibacillus humidisoli]UFJ39070.1 LysM peptidoglycan-binding domain-containing protein [Brevibacillus humidisoli]